MKPLQKRWMTQSFQKYTYSHISLQFHMNKKYQLPESSDRLFNLLLIAALSMGAHLELLSTTEILKIYIQIESSYPEKTIRT